MSAVKVKNKPVSIKSEVTEVTEVTSAIDVTYSGNLTENAEVTKVTFSLSDAVDPNETPPPELEKVKLERPCYGVYDDFNEFGKAGVYYHGIKVSKKDEVTETNDYICDPLHIDAGSCDISDNNYGLMLRFKNQNNRWRKWLMPLDMLSGGCEELRAECGFDPRSYLFTSTGLSDATTGYDNKRVIEALTKAGWLTRGSDSKAQGQKKIHGRNTKVYEITLKD